VRISPPPSGAGSSCLPAGLLVGKAPDRGGSATAQLPSSRGTPDLSVSLAPGIAVRGWSCDERCLFLTRYGHEYVGNDPATWASSGLLEIDLDSLPSADDQAETTVRAVTDALDLIKWALMTAADSTTAFMEAGVVLRSPSGWKGPTIRRQDSIVWNRPRHGFNIKPEYATRASELILRARKLMQWTSELAGILWFLGRAHNSATARDSLLEAAIGLESILVAHSGESTYKFRLHGSALLASAVNGDVDAELKRIYELRSRAAHGTDREEEDYRRLAPRARYLLAKAIVATIELSEAGELDLQEAKGDLGKATTSLVRKRCLIPRR
jgi:hypothetical protein